MDVFNAENIMLSKREAEILTELLEGISVGDHYCIELLAEYDLIRQDLNKRTLFFKTIDEKTFEMGYKKWYYIDKNLFIDTRSYL